MYFVPQNVMELSYEDLVADQEAVSRRAIEGVARGGLLEWDPRCLKFFKTKRLVDTASRWQVRRPIYDSSVGRWRNYSKPLARGMGVDIKNVQGGRGGVQEGDFLAHILKEGAGTKRTGGGRQEL